MAWGCNEDEYQIRGDIPWSRRTLLQVATKFNICFLLSLALACGLLFLVGVVSLAQNEEIETRLNSTPDPVVFVIVGMIGFSLFFPFFMALYFGRHFLKSVEQLECEVGRLKAVIGNNPPTGDGLGPK